MPVMQAAKEEIGIAFYNTNFKMQKRTSGQHPFSPSFANSVLLPACIYPGQNLSGQYFDKELLISSGSPVHGDGLLSICTMC